MLTLKHALRGPVSACARATNTEKLLERAVEGDKRHLLDALFAERPAPANTQYLHQAAALGHVDVLEAMIQHGVDPNTRGEDGETPLHHAVMIDDASTAYNAMQVLIQHGADPAVQDGDGQDAFEAAGRNPEVGAEMLRRVIDSSSAPSCSGGQSLVPSPSL